MKWRDPERIPLLILVTMVGTGLSSMAVGAFYLLVLLTHP
jgi:hypothetical protein